MGLRRRGDVLEFIVSDNGIGMMLIRDLARELRGKLTVETGNGTAITIMMPQARAKD